MRVLLHILFIYFCSVAIFTLSHQVLTDIEVKVLEKGLDFSPIHHIINESEMRRDFNEIYNRIRLNGIFGMSLKVFIKYQLLHLNQHDILREMLARKHF